MSSRIKLTTLPAKPHVAQWVNVHFSSSTIPPLERGCLQGGGLSPRIHPRHHSLLFNALRSNLTSHFHKRMIRAPFKCDTVDVQLPRVVEHMWVSRNGGQAVADILEEYWWEKTVNHLLKHIQVHNQPKEDALRAYLDHYGITESMYSLGNLRRRLHRENVQGLHQPEPETSIRFSYKLNNAQCFQIYRIHKKRKVSLRKLGEAYDLAHPGARNIFIKVSEYLSHNSPKNSPDSHAN